MKFICLVRQFPENLTINRKKMALHSAVKGKLISVIGDEDTCVGFLLGGVGEINKNRHPNFMVVDKSEYNEH